MTHRLFIHRFEGNSRSSGVIFTTSTRREKMGPKASNAVFHRGTSSLSTISGSCQPKQYSTSGSRGRPDIDYLNTAYR